MSSFATEAVGDFVVVAQTRKSPSDEEWRRNIELQTSIPADRARVLVWTEGGAPNAKQRAALNQALNGGQPRTAVLTPSSVARSIGTAISWFNPRLRVFGPGDLDDALDYLGAEKKDERAQLKETLERLRETLRENAPSG